jgi:hypothetical protein
MLDKEALGQVFSEYFGFHTHQHPSVFGILKPIWTYENTTLGYGFHFQHRNSRTLEIESLAHDSGSTLVCAECGYPKGSPNTNS